MNFSIFFTNQCNMNCTYCYEKNKRKQSISWDTIDKIVDFIVERHNNNLEEQVSVVTHGGEPLLEFDKIKFFIDKLNSKIDNVRYFITTNATLMSDDKIDFITKNYSDISISIDGTPQIHDMNRIFANGQGTYSVIEKNINKILSKDNKVKARMTVTPDTVSGLFDSIKHLVDLGFRTIIPAIDNFNDDWTEDDMANLFEQGKLITDYVKSYSESLCIGLIDDALSKLENSPCSGGTSTFSIDTDGKIYPCIISVGMPEFIIGNVYMGLDENKVKEIMDWDKVEISDCIGCSRYNYCNTTRCRIVNKIMCGELHTPSPVVCNIEHVKVLLSEYYMKVFSL